MLRSVPQRYLLDQLKIYLQKYTPIPKTATDRIARQNLIESLDEGHCHALSTVWSYCMLQTLFGQPRPGKPVDDMPWWFRSYQSIMDADLSSPDTLSSEEIICFESFLNHILLYQGNYDLDKGIISQTKFQSYFIHNWLEDTQCRQAKLEYSTCVPLELDDVAAFESFIKAAIHPGKLITFGVGHHSMSLMKDTDGQLYMFDSNKAYVLHDSSIETFKTDIRELYSTCLSYQHSDTESYTDNYLIFRVSSYDLGFIDASMASTYPDFTAYIQDKPLSFREIKKILVILIAQERHPETWQMFKSCMDYIQDNSLPLSDIKEILMLLIAHERHSEILYIFEHFEMSLSSICSEQPIIQLIISANYVHNKELPAKTFGIINTLIEQWPQLLKKPHNIYQAVLESLLRSNEELAIFLLEKLPTPPEALTQEIYDCLLTAARLGLMTSLSWIVSHQSLSAQTLQNALLCAMISDQPEAFEHILNSIIEHDFKDTVNFKTIILQAAETGNVHALSLLSSKGVSLAVKNRDGCSLMHIAIKNGHTELLTWLMANSLVDWTASDYDDGLGPLHYAAQTGDLDIFKLILIKITNSEQSAFISALTDDELNILHIASKYGHLDIVQYILSENLIDISAQDLDGRTALHWSLIQRHPEISQLLIKSTKNQSAVAQRDEQGFSPLYYAILYGFLEATASLIHKFPDALNQKFSGNSLLHIAILTENSYMVALILRENPELIEVQNGDGQTPLALAMDAGLAHIAKALINAGASQNYIHEHVDSEGYNLLHTAIEDKNLPMVRFLVETCHMPINTLTPHHETPLDLAKEVKSSEIQSYLKSQGGLSYASLALKKIKSTIPKMSLPKKKHFLTKKSEFERYQDQLERLEILSDNLEKEEEFQIIYEKLKTDILSNVLRKPELESRNLLLNILMPDFVSVLSTYAHLLHADKENLTALPEPLLAAANRFIADPSTDNFYSIYNITRNKSLTCPRGLFSRKSTQPLAKIKKEVDILFQLNRPSTLEMDPKTSI